MTQESGRAAQGRGGHREAEERSVRTGSEVPSDSSQEARDRRARRGELERPREPRGQGGRVSRHGAVTPNGDREYIAFIRDGTPSDEVR